MEASFLPEDRKPAGLVEATARLKSTGAARLLWAYDGETRSQIRRKTLLPEHFQHRQTENGIEAEYRAEYRGGIMSVESTVAPPGGAPVQRQTRYYRFNAIRDILSALAFLQNVDLPDGREIKLLVQPLDRLYLVSFAVLRRESRNVLGAPWSTIKLGVKVRGVRADLKLAPYSKMRSATIWLSDDDYRLPVEIDADLPVGFVSARLSSRNIR